MKRFFAFGCSFTQYFYPTWADIIGQSFEHYENWGQSGAGNQFISNSVVECHIKNTFTVDDTVIVMWSNVCRDDSYKNKTWNTGGNAYMALDIKDNDVRGYFLRDLSTIYLVKNLLDSIGCDYRFLSMVDIKNADQYSITDREEEISDLLEFYKDTLSCVFPSVHQVCFNYDWNSRPYIEASDWERYGSGFKKFYEEVRGKDWPVFSDFVLQKNLDDIPKSVLEEIHDENRWQWKFWKKKARRPDPHPTPLEHLEYIRKVLPEFPVDSKILPYLIEIDHCWAKNKPYDKLLKFFKSQNIQRW